MAKLQLGLQAAGDLGSALTGEDQLLNKIVNSAWKLQSEVNR